MRSGLQLLLHVAFSNYCSVSLIVSLAFSLPVCLKHMLCVCVSVHLLSVSLLWCVCVCVCGVCVCVCARVCIDSSFEHDMPKDAEGTASVFHGGPIRGRMTDTDGSRRPPIRHPDHMV